MYFTFILTVILSLSTYAMTELKGQIYDIDEGNKNEETLVFFTSGHIVRVEKKNSKKIKEYKSLFKNQKLLNLKIKQNKKIESYFHEEYTPTLVENLDLAKKYFHESKYVDKASQCYNRAHIWSYEWFTKNLINSNKTWLFFTRRYIRKFKFDWWFHVSPSMRVLDNGKEKEKIMDIKYARGPLDLKSWTDIFMKDDANCPMVGTYSEYANYPESGSCYTLRTSMYYYQPIDIETKEVWERSKTNWYKEELRQAFLEAFDQII